NSNRPGAPEIAPFRYGGAGWVPVVGDWDGDGKDTVGSVDPATQTWYLRNRASAGARTSPPSSMGRPGGTRSPGTGRARWPRPGRRPISDAAPAFRSREAALAPAASLGAPGVPLLTGVWPGPQPRPHARLTPAGSRSCRAPAVLSLALTPDAKFLASGAADGTARLWDVASGREIAVLEV